MARDAWFNELVPVVLPSYYRVEEDHPHENGVAWRGVNAKNGPFTVIMSGRIETDGKKWLHVSVAHATRLPSWELLKEIKRIFIGRERQAIQILPNEKNYINKHPYCLHLFCCIDEPDPVPNFVRDGLL